MLTYEKCSVCGEPTGNSLVCDRCHEIGEVKAQEYNDWYEQCEDEE